MWRSLEKPPETYTLTFTFSRCVQAMPDDSIELQVSASEGHVRQLAERLTDPEAARAETQRFVASFVRPHGMDRPATPIVAGTSASHQQIVANGWTNITGYDLTSGNELWRLRGGGDIPVASPIQAGTNSHDQSRALRRESVQMRFAPIQFEMPA